MPATVRSEFSLALNQVATERGLDPKIVLETIQAAILAAYRKDYGTDEIDTLVASVDSDTGEAKIVKDGKDVTPPGFGRIPELRIRRYHFRYRHAGPHRLAQLPEWPIGHSGHGCDDQIVPEDVRTDLHCGAGKKKWTAILAQRLPNGESETARVIAMRRRSCAA